MNKKLTDWFPADVKPVHIGMYERDWCGWHNAVDSRDYWDGKNWIIGMGGFPGGDISRIPRRWRGLTEPSDAAQ